MSPPNDRSSRRPRSQPAGKPSSSKRSSAQFERIQSLFDGLEVDADGSVRQEEPLQQDGSALAVEQSAPQINPEHADESASEADQFEEAAISQAITSEHHATIEEGSISSKEDAISSKPDDQAPDQAIQPIPAPAIFQPRGPSAERKPAQPTAWQPRQSGESPIQSDRASDLAIIQPGGDGRPAVLSFPVRDPAKLALQPGQTEQAKTGDLSSSLALEFLDEDPQRTWSEDEILLVEQVSSQLSLALENARLFEEARLRAEQLAILNEMSRKLSSQLEVSQVLETIYYYSGLLLDAKNFYVALVRELQGEQTEITFPLAVEDGQRQDWPARPARNGLTEHVINTQQPLLIPENVFGFLTQELKIDPVVIGRAAQSWLGVPMIYGGSVAGVIAVQNLEQPNSFNESHLELLNAIANQAAVAIENANLYSAEQRRRQIADALSDIARSVSSTLDLDKIADSVLMQLSKLIEFQSATLQLIDVVGDDNSNASDSDGRIQNGQVRHARRVIGEKIYSLPGEKPRPQSEAERLHRPVEDDPLIMEVLRTRRPVLLVDTHKDPRWEVLPETAHVRSWVATPLLGSTIGMGLNAGEQPVLGLLIVDHVRPDAYPPATLDLIAAISAQVSLGIQNARLFQQTQQALSETAALYQASAELNAVQSFDDILRTLRQYSLLGEADSLVNLSTFNRPWAGDSPPEWLVPVAHWTRLPLERLRQRYSLRSFPVTRLLSPLEPLVIEDIENDPRLQGEEGITVRKLYIETFEGRSTIFSPLFVGGRWIGLINAIFSQPRHFDQTAIRRLIALSGQAAIAVQNLNSIQLAQQRAQEAQERSEELGLINRVMSGVSSTLDLQESLDIVCYELGNALRALTGVALIETKAAEADGGADNLKTTDPSRAYTAQQLRVVSSYSPQTVMPDGSAPPNTVGMMIPIEGNLSTIQVIETRRPLLIQDPQNDPLTSSIHHILRNLDCRALLILPLTTSLEGSRQVIGTVAAEIIAEDRIFTQEELRLAETIVLQASTAIQNARLFEQNLRLLEETQRTASQLQTAAEIARDTSGTLALDSLLHRTVNQIRQRFGYYHVSIFLLDELGETAFIRESTGEAGEEMKRRSHGLLVGSQSIIGQVTANGEPLVINDVTSQAGQLIHRPNPLLPLTAAEMGVPLKISERVIGALDVQASRLNAFGPEDVAVIQVLADQIAVAVDNARSYEVAQKAVEEIREADRLKSQFLANMSHELRTPLNSIIGFSRVILKGIDGPINDQQHQDLSAIYNSGQHLLGLINDVLDLSKIEAGKMELALEDGVVLADIVRGVMSTTIGLVRDKPIALHQELSPDLPRLRVDAMKIRQVLINLLSNAAKFTEQGSITVSARLRPLPGDDQQRQVIVSVIDTGPGIAEADQVKLFQPFSQVDGSLTRKTGGSGLGLSICQHFVQMHGGEIGLDSEVGKGTTFWFTLPAPPAEVENEPEEVKTVGIQDAPAPSSQPADSALAEQVQAEKPIEDKQPQDGNGAQDPAPAAPQTDQAQAQQSTDSAGPSQVGGVILAIDKDPQVVGLYRRYLASQAYTVIALNELDQAVTVAGGIMPRAITLDIAMQSKKETQFGILDGWQILKGLKVDPATRNIPIIVCSLAVDEEKAYRMGAGAVLLKPILEEDLTQALQRLLKQSTG